MLDAFRRVTGHDLDPEVGPRRVGDPPILVADNRAILSALDWTPERDDLDRIIASAWAWEQTLDRLHAPLPSSVTPLT